MNIHKFKTLTLNNFLALPLKAKLLIVILISIMLFGAGYNQFIAEDLQKLIRVRAQARASAGLMKIKAQQSDKFLFYETQLQKSKDDFTEAVIVAHANRSDENLVDQLTKIGMANELQFKSIKTLSEKEEGDWLIQSVQIVLTGHYQQLVQFVNQVDALQKLLVWSEFVFEKEMTNSLTENLTDDYLNLTITMQVYSYLGEVNPRLMTKPKLKSHHQAILMARNIFAPQLSLDPSGTIGDPLVGFPLSALHLVGTILQDNNNWAFVLTPIGKVYRAHVGSRIGQHNGKITAISKNYIDVTEIKNREDIGEKIRLMLGK